MYENQCIYVYFSDSQVKKEICETWRFWTNNGAKQARCQKSTEIQKMRHISLNRYDATSYLDEFEDHCLTLKNAPHLITTCAAYETLVNEEDPTCSTPNTPHLIYNMRRIS